MSPPFQGSIRREDFGDDRDGDAGLVVTAGPQFNGINLFVAGGSVIGTSIYFLMSRRVMTYNEYLDEVLGSPFHGTVGYMVIRVWDLQLLRKIRYKQCSILTGDYWSSYYRRPWSL